MPRTLLAELVAATAQAGQAVAQLGELDLHHALLAARVLGEDVEDQRDPVDDVDVEELLEVALLRRGELVVEDDEVDVERVGELLQLAAPCPSRCRWRDRGVSRRCRTSSTGSAPAVSASSASSSSDASAASTSRAPMPVPTSSARCRTTPRSTSVAVRRRRAIRRRSRCAGSRAARPRRRTRATTGPPRRMVSPSSTHEVATGDVHDDALAHQPAPVRDRGDRARAGAAAQRLAHPPLPDPHVELVVGAGGDAHELDVGAASGTGRRARGADRAG